MSTRTNSEQLSRHAGMSGVYRDPQNRAIIVGQPLIRTRWFRVEQITHDFSQHASCWCTRICNHRMHHKRFLWNIIVGVHVSVYSSEAYSVYRDHRSPYADLDCCRQLDGIVGAAYIRSRPNMCSLDTGRSQTRSNHRYTHRIDQNGDPEWRTSGMTGRYRRRDPLATRLSIWIWSASWPCTCITSMRTTWVS